MIKKAEETLAEFETRVEGKRNGSDQALAATSVKIWLEEGGIYGAPLFSGYQQVPGDELFSTPNGFIRNRKKYEYREGQRYCHECGCEFMPDYGMETTVTCPHGCRESWVDEVTS